MTARPPKLSLADHVRAFAAKHSVDELRALRLATLPNSAQADVITAAITQKTNEAMEANQKRADAAQPPSAEELRARENMARIRLDHVEADLAMPTAAELDSEDIDAVVDLAIEHFLEADKKTPKKLPYIAVTTLVQRGLDQSKVGFDELVTFLHDQGGLDFHQRCEALRRLARRGMPIGGRRRRPEFDALPVTFTEDHTTNPEET